MLKWAKTEENLALQDVFSKVFEVSSMWTTLWKDFGEEVLVYCFIIFWNCRETRFDHQPALLLRKDDLMGGFATHMPSRLVYWRNKTRPERLKEIVSLVQNGTKYWFLS